MKYKLEDMCFYVKDKVDISKLTDETYISTENMLPNRGGVTKASSLPTTLQTQAYRKNDILVSNIRPYFKKIWYALDDGGCSNDVLVMRAKENTDTKFLYYVLATDNFFNYSTATSKGSKMPRGDKAAIMQYNVPTFDLEVQRKIAKILSAIDSKIENNNKINTELESMARTIYDYWFLQCEFPNEDGKPYKSSGGKMVWNEELKREIPEGWGVDEIGKHIDIDRGISYTANDLEREGIPLINLSSFNTNATYKPEGLKTYSGIYNKRKIIKPYDLMICVTQQTAIDLVGDTDVIGKSFLLPDIFDSKNIVASMDVIKIKADNDYGKYYLNKLINTKFFHRYISGFANGTKIKHLDIQGLLNYKCEMPERQVLSEFNRLMENIEEKKSRIIKENQELISLRDFLLPLLMNGQVGFKD